MAVIRPFRAVRPVPELAAKVAALPYDVMNSEEAREMVKAAQTAREISIDLWRFTSLINRNYTEEEKMRVMEMIWKVIYADGRLDGHEDYLVHNLAGLLRLSHSQLIEAKLRAKR